MYTLLGLFLFIITVVIGVQDKNPFLYNSLSPPPTSFRALYPDAFRPLLPPWSQLGKIIEIEPPREILLKPVVVKPAAPEAVEPSLPVIVCQSKEIEAFVKHQARRCGLEENLVRAVIWHESKFDCAAVSPRGAMGLMQLMPETAALMGVRNALDARQNIAGGVKFLKRCLDRFGQDVGLALAAYNAGPGNVEKYDGCPPFPETQKFVAQVMEKCYGRDWQKNTRITLPDAATLAKADTGQAGLQQEIPEAPKNYRIAKIERQVLGPPRQLSLPPLAADPRLDPLESPALIRGKSGLRLTTRRLPDSTLGLQAKRPNPPAF